MKIVLCIGILFISLFAKEVDIPNELKAWKSLSYVEAAKNIDELSNAKITLDKASFIKLHRKPKISYVKRAKNEGGSISYGGMFELKINEDGIYRLASSNGAWIDLIKDEKSKKSIAHKPGPQGTGIGKMLDFSLEAGVYVLQLSASADSTSAFLITKIK